jgi:hypothetical protein
MTFYDARPWNDLERSNVTQVDQTPIAHATYTHRAQILLIFALRQAVSEINDILWCATLKWPWKVKCNSGPPDNYYTCYIHPQGPNFAYFCSTTSRFRDKWHFMMCDLEMTLKGQMKLRSTKQLLYMLHRPPGPNFAYFCSTTSRFRDKWHFMMRDLEMTLKGQM